MGSDPERLRGGHYLGEIIRRSEAGPLILTETTYRAGTRLPRHAHEHAYICLVRRGYYREDFAGRSRDCGPATVAYHPPGESHAEHFDREDTYSFNVELGADWVRRLTEAVSGFGDPLESRGGIAATLAARLYREFRRPDEFSPLAVEGLTLEVVAELGRTSGFSRHRPPWLARVRDRLRAEFRRNHSLDQLAQDAGVHPVHLAASFRKHFGTSVGEYLRRCRVEHAGLLLATTALPAAEVALDAGFCDQSHLGRVFKRETGFTPDAYRREMRR